MTTMLIELPEEETKLFKQFLKKFNARILKVKKGSSENDKYFTPQMVKRVKQAQLEIKEGKGKTFNTVDELDKFFKSM